MKVFPFDGRRERMEEQERCPGKVRPARVAREVVVPEAVRESLAALAGKYRISLPTLEERFRHLEGYDLVRERFKERSEGERWDYILLILEERLKDER